MNQIRSFDIRVCPTHINHPRGSREIWVDGKRWAYAVAQAKGMHGFDYAIMEVSGHETLKTVIGKKSWLTSLGYYGRGKYPVEKAIRDGKFKTTDERITEAVRELIESGLLRSPAAASEDRKTAKRIALRNAEAIAAKDAELLDARAVELLSALAIAKDEPSRRQCVIAALRWAQIH